MKKMEVRIRACHPQETWGRVRVPTAKRNLGESELPKPNFKSVCFLSTLSTVSWPIAITKVFQRMLKEDCKSIMKAKVVLQVAKAIGN